MKVFLFIFIVYPTFLFCQIKSGVVTYGISYEFDEEMKNGLMSSYVDEAIQNAQYVTFKLEFNQEAMRFYPSDYMKIDGKRMDFVLAFSAANGVYYRTRDFGKNYHSIVTKWLGDFIIQYKGNPKWELTEETKMINDFLCYRANTTEVIENEAGVFTFPIIAWYCPQIPFPYGPKLYGGLPGLILELQERDALFGVQKIKLSDVESNIIDMPTKGKLITIEEFNKINFENSKSMQQE